MDQIPDIDDLDIDTDQIAGLVGTEGEDVTLIGFHDDTTVEVRGSLDEVMQRLGLEADDG